MNDADGSDRLKVPPLAEAPPAPPPWDTGPRPSGETPSGALGFAVIWLVIITGTVWFAAGHFPKQSLAPFRQPTSTMPVTEEKATYYHNLDAPLNVVSAPYCDNGSPGHRFALRHIAQGVITPDSPVKGFADHDTRSPLVCQIVTGADAKLTGRTIPGFQQAVAGEATVWVTEEDARRISGGTVEYVSHIASVKNNARSNAPNFAARAGVEKMSFNNGADTVLTYDMNLWRTPDATGRSSPKAVFAEGTVFHIKACAKGWCEGSIKTAGGDIIGFEPGVALQTASSQTQTFATYVDVLSLGP
jgi:hypothetical protein